MKGLEWRLMIKGGPGSGNFRHAGRPGQVGGSAPGKTRFYADAQTKVLVNNVTVNEERTNKEFAQQEIQRYMQAMPERFARLSSMRSLRVEEDSAYIWDYLNERRPDEAVAIDTSQEELLGFYDRDNGHAAVSLWNMEDHGYSGRNFYHEYGHSLDPFIVSDGWQDAWDEWEGGQDEAFADAFAEYMVALYSTDSDEMDWYKEYRPKSYKFFSSGR